MKRILVAANDSGGANTLVPVIHELLKEGTAICALLTGPAREVFKRANISFEEADSLTDAEVGKKIEAFAPTVFLAGTSGGMQIDKKVFPLVAGNIPTIYILDFWNNYTSRFSREGSDLAYLPDCICVMDEQAQKEMIAEGIPEDHIVVTGNPYFEHFTEGVTTKGEDKNRILFISQPISMGDYFGFTEFEALTDIISIVSELPEDYCLTIRLHPRDDKQKYSTFLNERVILSTETILESDLSRSGLIIGMFSPVLIQSALAGKSVISYEPHLSVPDPLPTNKSGLTSLAVDTECLRELIQRYLNSQPFSVSVGEWSQSGATNKVLLVLATAVPQNDTF